MTQRNKVACAENKSFLAPKEKAIDYLESEARKHKSCDTYNTIENSFGEDIDKAIDIALQEQATQIFQEVGETFYLVNRENEDDINFSITLSRLKHKYIKNEMSEDIKAIKKLFKKNNITAETLEELNK